MQDVSLCIDNDRGSNDRIDHFHEAAALHSLVFDEIRYQHGALYMGRDQLEGLPVTLAVATLIKLARQTHEGQLGVMAREHRHQGVTKALWRCPLAVDPAGQEFLVIDQFR